MIYLVTWHSTDGNDATVFDSVIGAKNEYAAKEKLFNKWIEDCPEAEEDGDFGIYYPCDCSEEDSEHCDGHGGAVIRTVDAFRSYDQANAARSRYHCDYTI